MLVGFSFTRLLPNGVTVDPAWAGFQNEGTITNATIELDASSIVGGWLGWFPVCPSGETTSLIEWDLTTPSGFGKIKSNGSIEGRSRQVQYQIRRVGEVKAIVDAGTDRLTLKHNSGNSYITSANLLANAAIRIGLSYVSET